MSSKKIGYIGLGKMGANMVEHLLEQNTEVVAWNRSDHKLKNANSLKELVGKLSPERIIWLMLPNGKPTADVLDELKKHLSKGDAIINGANEHWKESINYGESLSGIGVHYFDVGVSGGPMGARHGASLMIGGNKDQFNQLKWLWKQVAAPNAYSLLGSVGAGHFVKMVHNGIEYGMMESIAEGAAVLKSAEFNLDLAEVFRIYNNHTVVESRLVGWTHEALSEDSKLSDISSEIGHSGEGEWTIKEAQLNGVSTPALDASFKVRLESEEVDPNSINGFRNKIVSAQRGKFGGHPVKIGKN